MSSPFATFLRTLRVRSGMRQHELAKQLGYEQAYVSALELGNKPPSEEFLGSSVEVCLSMRKTIWKCGLRQKSRGGALCFPRMYQQRRICYATSFGKRLTGCIRRRSERYVNSFGLMSCLSISLCTARRVCADVKQGRMPKCKNGTNLGGLPRR